MNCCVSCGAPKGRFHWTGREKHPVEAVKQKQLERALEARIDEEVYQRLAEEINADS